MYPEEQGIAAQPKNPGPLTRAVGIAALSQPLVAPVQAFADGGAIRKETADELMARMTAKYGVPAAGPVQQPTAPVVQPPAQQPKPAIPQGGILNGAIEAIRNRKKQIDQAAGYSRGGKIQGPGTATSDSIPAEVAETGEPIRVANGERIVSAEQDRYLTKMAAEMGFDSLDAMLEHGTGKPVGPTIKGGQVAAAGGMLLGDAPTDPDTDGRRQYSANAGDAFINRGIAAPSVGVDSTQPRQTTSEPSPAMLPGKALNAAGNVEVDPSHLLQGTGIAALPKAGAPASFAPSPERFPMPGNDAASFMTGKATYSGFDKTGMAPPVAEPKPGHSANGVITADSAKAAMGDDMQRSGGIAGGIDMAGVNGILARENKIRGEMQDMKDAGSRLNSGTGVAILGGDGPTEADKINAERTNRWAIDDLRDSMKRAGTRTERAALGHALSQTIAGQGQQAAEQVRQQGAIEQRGIAAGVERARIAGIDQRATDRNEVAMRGQDITASTAADRITSQEKIAAQRTDDAGTRLTLPQRRSNFEIDAARERIAGLGPEEIKRKTANFTATGRENPDFDPTLAKAVSLANRRKYGTDDHFDQREQAQQPAGTDGDVVTRFRADPEVQGYKLGKQTDRGYEVFDSAGNLKGHWN